MTHASADAGRRAYRMSGGFKLFLGLLAAAVVLPAVLWVTLYAIVIGGSLASDVRNSGSATGPAALERARNALHDLGNGRWRAVATDARANWDAGDMGGDRIEHYAFTLPPAEVAPFQAALDAQWTLRPLDGRDSDDPRVNYVFEGASLVLDRETGRVRIEWANFFSHTPATNPAGRAAGQRPATAPAAAFTRN